MMHADAAPTAAAAANLASPTYAKLRLYLGMTCVATWVGVALVGLLFDAPGRIAAAAGVTNAWLIVFGFVGLVAIAQIPFDLLGGFLLPKARGRAHPAAGRLAATLGRGVLVYSLLLGVSLSAVRIGAGLAGVGGAVAAGVALTALYLVARPVVASVLARLVPAGEVLSGSEGARFRLVESSDEGFTGGVGGAIRPTVHLVPAAWRERLAPEEFDAAVLRRSLAVRTGSFLRGRLAAAAFTVAGIAISTMLVGGDRLATGVGAVEMSLWFTLWSFLGLITLPTISRRGVYEVDAACRAEGVPADVLARAAAALDGMQDDEPARRPLIETIFHPLPSVSRRLAAANRNAGRPAEHRPRGAWDAARTAVYLNLAGGGLLGRAVHCNCGRPALWAFLPAD